jgi:gas vesicle protein
MPRPDRIMEHNNNHNQNSGSGFLLGVIVGVLLTLLLTTKKGRAILKELMEKGIEKFANLEEIINETEGDFDDLDDEEGDDFIPSEPVKLSEPPKEKKEPLKKNEEEIPSEQVKKETVPAKINKEEIDKEEKTDQEKPPEEESKPKPVRGRRWFRGLRKKS